MSTLAVIQHAYARGRRTVSRRAAYIVTPFLLVGCVMSTQQEVQVGTQYAQQINAQLPIVRDASVNQYINSLGMSLARLTDRRGLSWRFFVVDSREVNAFAVPGGFVYVNRGLIERARTMNQLAGVLAHEIAHVTERHSVEQLAQAQRADLGISLACILTSVCQSGVGSAAIQVGGSALFAKFSRDDEAQADARAVTTLVRAKIDPRGIVNMFQTLLNERRSRPTAVDAWFRTHPLEEDRIAETNSRIAQVPAAQLRGLTVDTQGYQSFRSRLVGLPVQAARRTR
ncbi:MAG TPA: M48 family metallopeptidase [Gemmatimonadaceae bacterium]|nr:M48 family metallopeptidase [Gemmatimonadaceae bacterium]